MIIKTDIELQTGAIVDCFCCNGFAFAVEQSKEERKFCYYLNYPTLEKVLSNDDMCAEILTYCGLYDLTKNDINFGDIMLTYGEISKPIKDNLNTMVEKLKQNSLNNDLINIAYKQINCVLSNMNC